VPSCKRSSRGEKDDPTGRAAEAGPAQDDVLAGGDGERPIGQGFLRIVQSLGGSLAARAGDGLVGRRVGGPVGVGVVVEQLQGEGLAEVVGALLALVEGDEIVVVGEHEVEGLGGVLQELLAE
jgi:membrane-associated protease RseP (regulator of RpoE activity)